MAVEDDAAGGRTGIERFGQRGLGCRVVDDVDAHAARDRALEAVEAFPGSGEMAVDGDDDGEAAAPPAGGTRRIAGVIGRNRGEPGGGLDLGAAGETGPE